MIKGRFTEQYMTVCLQLTLISWGQRLFTRTRTRTLTHWGLLTLLHDGRVFSGLHFALATLRRQLGLGLTLLKSTLNKKSRGHNLGLGNVVLTSQARVSPRTVLDVLGFSGAHSNGYRVSRTSTLHHSFFCSSS